jgi:2-iminobutanoate/2-iminopropanoate deaminase
MKRAPLVAACASLLAFSACTSPRERVLTDRAPKPIGPYSQAVRANDTLWASGQIGLDPSTGALVAGGIEAETRQALANLRAVLEQAKMSLSDVVATQVFLTDLGDFAAFNAIYAESFSGPSPAPARTTVGVAALPKGAHVEIACTAVRWR